MIIESIHIASFGKLHDLDMAFDTHLNMIYGANESGKSTLAAFLRFMLYGFDRDAVSEVTEEVHRMPWDGSPCAGSMVFTAGGKKYRIDRRIALDGDRREESAVTTDLETGLPVFPRLSAGQAFLDVPLSLFDRTAFVGRLSDSTQGGIPLADAIENLIFSGDEKVDTVRALSALAEAKGSLLHPNGRGGVISTLRQKEEELSRRLQIARTEQATILKKEASLLETQKKKAEAKKEEDASVRLEADYKNVMLIKTYDYLHELEENHAALEKELSDMREPSVLGGFPPTEETRVRLNILAEKEEKLRTTRTEAKESFDSILKDDPATREDRKRIMLLENTGGTDAVSEDARHKRLYMVLYFLFSSLSLLLAVGSVFLDIFVFSVSYTAFDSDALFAVLTKVLLLAFSAGFFLLFLQARKKLSLLYRNYGVKGAFALRDSLKRLSDLKTVVAAREKHLGALRRESERTEDAYLDLLEEATAYLMTGGITLQKDAPYTSLSETLQLVTAHLEKMADLEKKKSGVFGVIQELRGQLGDRNEVQIRATVPPADRERLAALSHRELTDGIEHYRRLYRFYDDKERELVRQITASRRQAEDPYLLESEAVALQEKLTALFSRHSAYDLAEDAIRNAGERLRTEISPRLTKYACRLMETVTDGKYSDLDIDKDIALSFKDNEVLRNTAFLSEGTRDIAYFSLRMALIDLLYNENPPLFFDESFAHQDKIRVKGAFRALRLLAEEDRQIFFFTCHERDSETAQSVFPDYRLISISEKG